MTSWRKNISGTWEKEELEKILVTSNYIDEKRINEISLISQAHVEEFYDIVNGIDEAFANANTITLLQRDGHFNSDREVWQAVAEDQSLVIVSEFRLDRDIRPGDTVTLGNSQKRVVAVAKYEGDSYEFPTSYGMWVSDKALSEFVSDERLITKTVLLKVDKAYSLADTAKSIEKEFTLNNIYPLINPTEMAVVNSSFILMFFSLFEGFNALATIIGIVGLMIVMIRVIRERRQQIGMLRAIGISPKLIYWSYLIEGAVIAVIGITIGIVVGAYGGDMMLQSLMNDANEEIERIEVIFPYVKIAVYYLGSLFLTLLLIALPARATMKLSPAEATRYIS
ncbi:ABC transporter permease [Anaerobacillus alkaliphilus]|uniref:ABC transporter permease n=1 Tax=Anaerobacillus alkaliphilus TaxID=1548597 RepID=A0A4Q0VV49_9BACI|nr:FtsX-like permease family protein [Anaerobacillus alkaliphilus]RXJ02363.1 ABC transporter permease [Anaerobacillus alkaliphilus]